jgi:uncharacterized protein (TIGR02186 family)
MSRIKSQAWCALLLCVALTATHAALRAGDNTDEPQLTPDQVDIGVFYRGAEVRVTADVPAVDGAVLVLEEDGEEVTLNRKGRKAGIWLNVAQVTFSNVPKVYILASSNRLDDICSGDVQRELGLGTQSLLDRMSIACEKPLIGTEADEFLKLKMQSGAYNTDIGITLTPDGTGRQRLFAVLPIPAAVPPGIYRVVLYCFTNGYLVQQGMTELRIERVGLAHLMASLAHERASLYGVLAISIAMAVGLVIGVIFHSLPGSGH